VIKSVEDCKLLQSDIHSVHKLCIKNYMKINISKTNIISFIRETNRFHLNYFLGDLLIIRTDCVKNLEFMLVRKLHFRHHVDYLHSQATEAVRTNFSSLDSLIRSFLYHYNSFKV
jgi:hypothetical protein